MTELPIRMFFVGEFDSEGNMVNLCVIEPIKQPAIVVFTEELLAERWRDEFQPHREVREATSQEQAGEWIDAVRRKAPAIKYLARDATTIGAEGHKKALYVKLPVDD